MAEWYTETQSKLDTSSLCSKESPGGGSAWYVMSTCFTPGLSVQRELAIREMDTGEWRRSVEVEAAFRWTVTLERMPCGWRLRDWQGRVGRCTEQ